MAQKCARGLRRQRVTIQNESHATARNELPRGAVGLSQRTNRCCSARKKPHTPSTQQGLTCVQMRQAYANKLRSISRGSSVLTCDCCFTPVERSTQISDSFTVANTQSHHLPFENYTHNMYSITCQNMDHMFQVANPVMYKKTCSNAESTVPILVFRRLEACRKDSSSRVRHNKVSKGHWFSAVVCAQI